MGEVNTDKGKISWCPLLIGATGSSILTGLEDDASWEIAKETLLSRRGVAPSETKPGQPLSNLREAPRK